MLIISSFIVILVIVAVVYKDSKNNLVLQYYIKQTLRVTFVAFVLITCTEAIVYSNDKLNELSIFIIAIVMIIYLSISVYFMIEQHRQHTLNKSNKRLADNNVTVYRDNIFLFNAVLEHIYDYDGFNLYVVRYQSKYYICEFKDNKYKYVNVYYSHDSIVKEYVDGLIKQEYDDKSNDCKCKLETVALYDIDGVTLLGDGVVKCEYHHAVYGTYYLVEYGDSVYVCKRQGKFEMRVDDLAGDDGNKFEYAGVIEEYFGFVDMNK